MHFYNNFLVNVTGKVDLDTCLAAMVHSFMRTVFVVNERAIEK